MAILRYRLGNSKQTCILLRVTDGTVNRLDELAPLIQAIYRTDR